MGQLFGDTSLEAENVIVAMMREASVERKAQMVDQLSIFLRRQVWHGVQQRFPEASEAVQRWKYAEQLFGPTLTAAMLGQLPEMER